MVKTKAEKQILVIVESPTKAKTISRFLPSSYLVKSSFGHIRDLPKSKIGVEVDKNFEPTYVIPKNASKTVTQLKKDAAKTSEVILATDEDREGEAIAWHITEALKISPEKTKRIVFHEITKEAILEAIKNPRTINFLLVNAQQARRILDRLVGYKLSPFLWSKIRRGLSAGRVQSVAVRLIVDREREIENFKADEYWTIAAELEKDQQKFVANLAARDGQKITKLEINNKTAAEKITAEADNQKFVVSKVIKKTVRKFSRPPFITSTLQQEASRKLGFSAKQTMMLAQQLYEGVTIDGETTGLITYMRTDSINLSNDALNQVRQEISAQFGNNYLPPKPRFFTNKSKHAQEAHESIRPTRFDRFPKDTAGFLDSRQAKLYELIWRRAIASQMSESLIDSTSADITAGRYTFRATGFQVKFDGFMKVYTESKDTENGKNGANETVLPNLAENDLLKLNKLTPVQHFTEAAPRYTEASLVKALEENGIGRPSTYAPIMSTIITRGYVEKLERKFHPTEIGIMVNDLLAKHFPEIVDLKFTAGMEDKLDEVADNKIEWHKLLGDFYQPFNKLIMSKQEEIKKSDITEEKTDQICEKCGKPMIIKMGRFGKFLACSGYPECKNTKPLGDDKKLADEKSNEVCDKCGKPMAVKRGKFGPFLGCTGYPECKNIKKIEKLLGVSCPECQKGEIVEKRSKKGRNFFACNRYPDCKFALWQKPTGEKCPNCSSLLVFAAQNKIRCSKKECGFEKEGEVIKSE